VQQVLKGRTQRKPEGFIHSHSAQGIEQSWEIKSLDKSRLKLPGGII
jgi:hypothetical protein